MVKTTTDIEDRQLIKAQDYLSKALRSYIKK